MLSNDRQTNKDFVEIDSEDVLNFSRIEPLRHLLVVLSESVEEDGLLSSKPRTQRESDSLVQYQSNSFHSSEWCSVNNQQVPFFAVLLLPLIGMQNPSPSVVTLVLQADLQELLCRCCSNRSNLLGPWECLTQDWVLSPLRDQILISTPCLLYKQLVVSSSTGPIFVLPWIHPFGCDDPSSLGRVYSRQAFA